MDNRRTSSLFTLSDKSITTRKISDLSPKQLIGSSITLYEDKLLLFGGLDSTTKTLSNKLYELDLNSTNSTSEWKILSTSNSNNDSNSSNSIYQPRGRYYHSATLIGKDKLLILGGFNSLVEEQRYHQLELKINADKINDHEEEELLLFDLTLNKWILLLPTSSHLDNSDNQNRFSTSVKNSITWVNEEESLFYTIGGSIESDTNGNEKVLSDKVRVMDLNKVDWISCESLNLENGDGISSERSCITSKIDNDLEGNNNLPFSIHTSSNITNQDSELSYLTPPASPSSISSTQLLSLPPNLQYPQAHLIGINTLLVFGFDLNLNRIRIWSRDNVNVDKVVTNEDWREISSGKASWKIEGSRAILWKNQLVVLSGENKISTEEKSFDTIHLIDLEAFGIYHPPKFNTPSTELLNQISQDSKTGDFAIVSSNGMKHLCSRDKLSSKLLSILDSESNLDQLHLALDSSTVLILIFYLYTQSLPIEPNSPTLSNLSSLLKFTNINSNSTRDQQQQSTMEVEPNHLRSLVLHALHQGLNNGSFTPIGVYQASTVGASTALQIRSLEKLMGGTTAVKEKKVKQITPIKVTEEKYENDSFASAPQSQLPPPPDSLPPLPIPMTRAQKRSTTLIQALAPLTVPTISLPSLPAQSNEVSNSNSYNGNNSVIVPPSLNYRRPSNVSRMNSNDRPHQQLQRQEIQNISPYDFDSSNYNSNPVSRGMRKITSDDGGMRRNFSEGVGGFNGNGSKKKEIDLQTAFINVRRVPSLPLLNSTSTVAAPILTTLPKLQVIIPTPTPITPPNSSNNSSSLTPLEGHPPPLVINSKSLSISLPCPRKFAYFPNDVLTFTVSSLSGGKSSSLSNLFTNLEFKLQGTCSLEGGNLVASKHTLFEKIVEIDFTNEESSITYSGKDSFDINIELPSVISCEECKKNTTLTNNVEGIERMNLILPGTCRIFLGNMRMSSAAEGCAFSVEYKVEVTGKRKGWGRGTEKITMPFPVGYEKDFGEYIDTREECIERTNKLLDSEWICIESTTSRGSIATSPSVLSLGSPLSSGMRSRSRSISSSIGNVSNNSGSISIPNTSTFKILSSSLSYVTYSLLPTSTIHLAWKLNLLLPTSELSQFLPILSELQVQPGRRIIQFFSNKKGTGEEAARLYPMIIQKGCSSIYSEDSVKRTDLGQNSGVSKLEVNGWIEFRKDLVEGGKSCNGEVRHYLTASLKDPSVIVISPLVKTKTGPTSPGINGNPPAPDGIVLGLEVEIFKSKEKVGTSILNEFDNSSDHRISTAPSSNSASSKNSSSSSGNNNGKKSTSPLSLGAFGRKLTSNSSFSNAYSLQGSTASIANPNLNYDLPSITTTGIKRSSSNFSDTATYNSRFSISSDSGETIRSVDGSHKYSLSSKPSMRSSSSLNSDNVRVGERKAGGMLTVTKDSIVNKTKSKRAGAGGGVEGQDKNLEEALLLYHLSPGSTIGGFGFGKHV